MSSSIDTTQPIAGSPTTQSVRDNFTAAKAEIEVLQAGKVDKSSITPQSLTSSGAVVAIDLSAGENFEHTLTENTALANPTNPIIGQSGHIVIRQNGTAAKTFGFASNWKSHDGITPTLPSTLNAVALVRYYCYAADSVAFEFVTFGVL